MATPTIIASTQAPPIKNYIRGDSRVLNFQFYQVDGITPFNLTNCEVFFTLNLSSTPPDDGSDTTAAIKISTTTFNNPASGQASLTLTNALTQPLVGGVYYYDVQLKDANGNITSLASNTFLVLDDITTRIS